MLGRQHISKVLQSTLNKTVKTFSLVTRSQDKAITLLQLTGAGSYGLQLTSLTCIRHRLILRHHAMISSLL